LETVAGKKVVLIIAPTPAPYRAFEYDLVQRALADEYRFHALFMERRWGDMNWQDDVPAVMDWRVLPQLRLPRAIHRIPGLRRTNRGTKKVLDSLDPDAVILHGNDSPALWAAFFWARRRRRAVLFRSDANIDKELRRARRFLWTALRKRVIQALYSRVDAFLTIGSANEACYELLGADPARFFRTSFTTYAEMFTEAADRHRKEREAIKKELGIRQEKVLLFVGRFVWQKDIETAVRAFAAALPDIGDTAFLLVGDGPEVEKVKAVAEPIRGNVYFGGFRQPEEMGSVFAIADALLLGSIAEPWGLVVNEAMAAGLAVIASDRVGCARDLVLPGRTGEIFPAGDEDSLAQALRDVLADASVAARMGQAGRRHLQDWNRRHDVVEGYRHALDTSIERQRCGRSGRCHGRQDGQSSSRPAGGRGI